MKSRSYSRVVGTLFLGTLFLAATTIFAQKLTADRSTDEVTTKLVCEMVQQFHISEKKINDEISKKLLDRYIETLDSRKLFFLQSDINKLREYEVKLDDLVQEGNLDFAFDTFELKRRRVRERVALAHRLIDQEHDFTVDEEMIVDPDTIPWARNEQEINERWRKRIKYEFVSLRLEDNSDEEIRDRLHKRYNGLQRSTDQTEKHEILEMYLGAMTHAFDPHSSYMSPQTVEDFEIQMRLSLEGIGAALSEQDGYTIVESIVPDGAAAKDGRLKKGDKIIGVDSGDGEMINIVEMKLSKVVRLIRGPKGTVVRLKVKTADEKNDDGEIVKKGSEHIYELTRQVIQLQEAAVKGDIIKTGDRLKGTDRRIGVIRIPSFYRDFDGASQGTANFKSAARDVRKVLQDFENQGGVDAIIIDLRYNGGGALTEAIDVTGLFIDEGPVVQVKEQNGNIKPYHDLESGVAYTGPLVVLCNRLSASASEIFAGAIKDYGRGIVIGDETTHGKGTVQNVMPVPGRQLFSFRSRPQNRGVLKLTISQFYRVNGDSTQNRGVPSDVTLPSLLDHMEFGEKFLDNALKFDQIEPAQHDPVAMSSDNLIERLKALSTKRVKADEKFQETFDNIENYLDKKSRKTVSLMEDKLRKERQEEKELEEQRKKAAEAEGMAVREDGEDSEDVPESEKPVFPDDHYNDEVLHICLDYLNLLGDRKTADK